MTVTLLIGLLAAPASACTPPATEPFRVGSYGGDDVAPLAPELVDATVVRGRPKPLDPRRGSADCYDRTTGMLSFAIELAGEFDPEEAAGSIGYYDEPPVGFA